MYQCFRLGPIQITCILGLNMQHFMSSNMRYIFLNQKLWYSLRIVAEYTGHVQGRSKEGGGARALIIRYQYTHFLKFSAQRQAFCCSLDVSFSQLRIALRPYQYIPFSKIFCLAASFFLLSRCFFLNVLYVAGISLLQIHIIIFS